MKKRKLLALLLSAAMLTTQITTAYAADVTPDVAESDELIGRILPYGLKGMPTGYSLRAEDKALKARTRSTVEDIAKMIPGTDYAPDQIVYITDTREEAETVAEAYNAVLVKYQYGVATAMLTGGLTVAQAVEVGSDESYNMPIVSPNFISELEEPTAAKDAPDEGVPEAQESDAGISWWEDWYYRYEEPALKPGYLFKDKDPFDPSGEGTDTKGYQWMHDAVGTYDAWHTTMGDPNITVAVIDTGVDDKHVDLSHNTRNLTDVVALEHTEYEYDENGNYVTKIVQDERFDYNGHGTHVAGIIGAAANGVGGAGIAPNVSIIGIPVFVRVGSACSAYDETVISAIRYVAGYNKDGTKGAPRANIINMSLNSPAWDSAKQEAIIDAYNNNITVCASMSNDRSNLPAPPANYDHVIAVCATERDNSLAFFSNYGAWADISAPGYNIFSTWNGHSVTSDGKEALTDQHDWFQLKSGTSMASPVVAGACALYMSAVGPVDPDTMEAVLKSSATKLSGKDMGAGLVNVAAMMPDTVGNSAPVIYVNDEPVKTSEVTAETAEISIGAPDNVGAYFAIFSVDGKDPTFKNGKLGKNTFSAGFGYDIPLSEYSNDDVITFKAALVSSTGSVSKVSAVTIKQTQYSLGIDGPGIVAVGKSANYSIGYWSTLPKKANILWSLANAPSGVSIKNGKLTVKKDVPVGTQFSVVATLDGNSSVTDSIDVITALPNTSVWVDFDSEELEAGSAVYTPVADKKAGFKSIRLYSADIPNTEIVENLITPYFVSTYEGEVTISSSDPDVAYYDGSYIVGAKAGKAKFTFALTDGSAKKCTLDVVVINPASDLDLRSVNNQNIIAFGKSAQLVPMLGQSYGKPTISAMSWRYKLTALYIDENGTEHKENLTETANKAKLVTVSKTGKVSVSAKTPSVLDLPETKTINGITCTFNEFRLYVYCDTTDGTGLSASFVFRLSAPTKSLVHLARTDSDITVKGNKISLPIYVDKTGKAQYTAAFELPICNFGSDHSKDSNNYLFTSSNPEVASAKLSGIVYNESTGLYAANLMIVVNKAGKANITVTANDGTGKKVTVTIDVKGIR